MKRSRYLFVITSYYFFAYFHHHRTPIHILLFNLAVADGLFALLIAPKLIVSLNSKHPEGTGGSVLCLLITGGAFAWVAALCAIYTLVAIAVERYYAVTDPYGKKWNLTKRKLKVRSDSVFLHFKLRWKH